MKIYAYKDDIIHTFDRLIGKDVWYGRLSKADPNRILYWGRVIGKHNIAGQIYYDENLLFDDEYYTMDKLNKQQRIALMHDVCSHHAKFSVSEVDPTELSELTSEALTTAELFRLDEDDVK